MNSKSTDINQTLLNPFNHLLVNDTYINKTILNSNDNISSSCLINIDYKEFFRTKHFHVAHKLRSSLWLNILRQNKLRFQYDFEKTINGYSDDVCNMFGRQNEISVQLPSCIDIDHLPNYHLNENGQNARRRILCIFSYYHPDITWTPLLGSIAALFLHYMTEIDAYECLLVLNKMNYKILTQTDIQYQSLLISFRTLLNRHCHSTYKIICKYQENLLDLWLWVIFEYLPFEYLVPVVDYVLVDDIKILVRLSMTLYHYFVQNVINHKVNYSLFHRTKFTYFLSHTNSIDQDRLICFIENIDIPIDKLFKYAFNIHFLKRTDIHRTIQMEEDKLKIERHLPRCQLPKSSSTSTTSTTSNKQFYSQQNSMIMIHEFDTKTASHADFAYLWSLIPNRLTTFQPERIYSSDIHGRRLRTFYNHVEYHENCFIIILNELEEIFGAFCSSPLSIRSNVRTWFGTGESFLFTLKPKRECFKWIGYQKCSNNQTKPHEDYFIYADDERFQIGGSKEPLNIGLCIENSLNQGNTRECDTFTNKPLSSIENFQIIAMEVFGFK